MASLPLVGLPTDRKHIGPHPFLAAGEKYVRAVVDGAGALPVLLPTLQPALPLRELLQSVDGILLTGSVSNVEPHHYSDEPSYEGNLHDPARDATTLGLVPLALELGVPLLALCRGFQEVNVALGGTFTRKCMSSPVCWTTAKTPTTRWKNSTRPRMRSPSIRRRAGRHRRCAVAAGQLAARAGRGAAGQAPEGGSGGAGRPGRGLPPRRPGLPARRAVASGMACRRKSFLPRHIQGLRRCLPRPTRRNETTEATP